MHSRKIIFIFFLFCYTYCSSFTKVDSVIKENSEIFPNIDIIEKNPEIVVSPEWDNSSDCKVPAVKGLFGSSEGIFREYFILLDQVRIGNKKYNETIEGYEKEENRFYKLVLQKEENIFFEFSSIIVKTIIKYFTTFSWRTYKIQKCGSIQKEEEKILEKFIKDDPKGFYNLVRKVQEDMLAVNESNYIAHVLDQDTIVLIDRNSNNLFPLSINKTGIKKIQTIEKSTLEKLLNPLDICKITIPSKSNIPLYGVVLSEKKNSDGEIKDFLIMPVIVKNLKIKADDCKQIQ